MEVVNHEAPSFQSAPTPRSDTRSLGDLLKDLSTESKTLVSQEIELAKAEFVEKATKVGVDVGLIAAGAFIALLGAVALLYFVVQIVAFGLMKAGLNEHTAEWVSPLIVGGLITGAGVFLILKGLDRLKHEPLKPRKTVETIQETKEWMKEKLS